MINVFDDPDAVVELGPCDGLDELFYRLMVKNKEDKFVFHLTPEQVEKLRENIS